jgi:putative membrane protein
MTILHRSIVVSIAVVAFGGGVAASAHAAALSGLDKQYLTTAIQGDRFEIAGGQLAQTKSQNATIRALGARLAKDHTKSLHDAVRLAHRFHVDVPKAPSPTQRFELQIVGSLTGPAFDQWYARLEVADHHQDIAEAADEVTDGFNQQVRSAAHDEIPTLRTHLHLSEAALKSVGG